MASGKLKSPALPDSLLEAMEAIKAGKSFIVEAGAGSGKTWTLIECLKFLLDEYGAGLKQNNQKIVCITYTNIAVDEIRERIENSPLVEVNTIHEFLWSVVENYQSELKNEILEYNNTESSKPVEDLETLIADKKITYSKYGRKYEEGRIFHDDVILLAEKIFSKYPKILKIVADRYPFIFVDEYQDTQQKTVDLLLKHLLPDSEKLVLGFFGDSMQKIYTSGVGKIRDDQLVVVTKKENFRCSVKVIELLNKMRSDIQQIPSGKNLDGELQFIHCNQQLEPEKANYVKTLEYLKNTKGWNIEPPKTKILMLTHKGIAGKLDYENLLNVYDKLSFGRERLYDTDEVFSALFVHKIESLVSFYEEKKYTEFINLLGIEGFKVEKHEDKKRIQELMDQLSDLRKTGTVKDVIDFVFTKKLTVKPQRIIDFEDKISAPELDESTAKKKEFYELLMQVKYQEVINFNRFIQEQTPLSTKHGVKGAEYENVLVVIDDKAWTMYKFNDVFSGNTSNQGRYDRTLNLLYVCCSRAKDKLAILNLSELEPAAITALEGWFGSSNVVNINDL